MDCTYSNTKIHNVAIVGSGPAGLTCGIYCGRSGLEPIVFSGPMPGGQLTTTSCVENYPGIASISGPDLMMNMIEHATKSGVNIEYETIQAINIIREDTHDMQLFCLTQDSSKQIIAKSVVIATGSNHKRLNIPGEKSLANKGVSWCATCDGPMYKGKSVAVIGGGNSAVTEAVFLSNIANKVYLVHRRDQLSAEKTMQDKLFAENKVQCVWNSNVTKINGDKHVESIAITDTNNDISHINVDAVFIAIGLTPCSQFVANIVDLDDAGYIKTKCTETSIPGIFAIGDVVQNSLKQAVYSAGQGSLCAYMVEKYLGMR